MSYSSASSWSCWKCDAISDWLTLGTSVKLYIKFVNSEKKEKKKEIYVNENQQTIP